MAYDASILSDSFVPWRSVQPGPATDELSAVSHSTCPSPLFLDNHLFVLRHQCSDEHADDTHIMKRHILVLAVS